MFEDLEGDSGYTPASRNTPPSGQPAPQNNPPPPAPNGYRPSTPAPSSGGYGQQGGGYQQNRSQGGGYNQGGGGGGYGGGGGGGYGGGGNNFGKREDVLQDAYIPVAFYVEKDFPQEIKEALFNLASKMLAKKMTVRINADDKEFIDRLGVLSKDKLEVYLPWRNFNEIESKKTYNTTTCKAVAAQHFAGWEKIPDSVKAILSAQVRLVFGDKNNSNALCVVTWTRDGASKGAEVTKDTGRSSFIIKMASFYGFPVMNIERPRVIGMLESNYSLI